MNDGLQFDAKDIEASQKLFSLVELAKHGDAAALSALRSALKSQPALWKQVTSLGRTVEEAWLKQLGNDQATYELLIHQLAELKQNLERESPSDLVRLLVQRVAICWLEIHQADLAAASAATRSGDRLANLAIKRQASAHRRYLSAIKALALIRKLGPKAA